MCSHCTDRLYMYQNEHALTGKFLIQLSDLGSHGLKDAAKNASTNGGDASRVGIEIGVKYERCYC